MIPLPPQAREAVISAMYPVHVDPGQEVITQGSLDASKFYVIEAGQVRNLFSQNKGKCRRKRNFKTKNEQLQMSNIFIYFSVHVYR